MLHKRVRRAARWQALDTSFRESPADGQLLRTEFRSMLQQRDETPVRLRYLAQAKRHATSWRGRGVCGSAAGDDSRGGGQSQSALCMSAASRPALHASNRIRVEYAIGSSPTAPGARPWSIAATASETVDRPSPPPSSPDPLQARPARAASSSYRTALTHALAQQETLSRRPRSTLPSLNHRHHTQMA